MPAPQLSSEAIHAASVAIGERAVLIEGCTPEDRIGLALRLIDRGAVLIADESTICQRQAHKLLAGPPAGRAGKMLVRGIGDLAMEHVAQLPVALIAVLLESPPRNPEDARTRNIAGIDVPVLALGVQDMAGHIKVDLALRQAQA
jgi:serine kinase of HPr protein (carbohydrate metabolism regulator)